MSDEQRRRIDPVVQADIEIERAFQEQKHGVNNHSPFEWAGLATEEIGEAMRHAVPLHFNGPDSGHLLRYRAEMVQVAATAIAALEAFDRMVGRVAR